MGEDQLLEQVFEVKDDYVEPEMEPWKAGHDCIFCLCLLVILVKSDRRIKSYCR